jgi:diguanylate cyclase (GGDEF)-like protein
MTHPSSHLEHPGHEIEDVEKRLQWAFFCIACLCTIVLILVAFLLLRWPMLSTVIVGVTIALAVVSVIVMFYAFDNLHRTSHSIRERLEELTFVDEATGVYNYRYLDIRLHEEMERIRRYGGSSAVLYLDLDRFKLVNDRFGHPTGNVVLMDIAQLLRRSIRGCDIVGRLGGDEFLVISPDTGPEQAAVLGRRMVRAVQDYTRETSGGSVIDFLSLKVGVAAFPANGRAIDEVIRAADNAVYEAKAQGGNRVCVAENGAGPAAAESEAPEQS